MSDRDYSSYKFAWRKRFEQKRQKRHNLKMEARSAAEKAAKFLAKQFGVRKVYLFGSVLRDDDFFYEKSDIDLAVEGLPEGRYIEMLVSLENEVKPPVMINVVQMENCRKSLRDKILTKGKLLYAK